MSSFGAMPSAISPAPSTSNAQTPSTSVPPCPEAASEVAARTTGHPAEVEHGTRVFQHDRPVVGVELARCGLGVEAAAVERREIDDDHRSELDVGRRRGRDEHEARAGEDRKPWRGEGNMPSLCIGPQSSSPSWTRSGRYNLRAHYRARAIRTAAILPSNDARPLNRSRHHRRLRGSFAQRRLPTSETEPQEAEHAQDRSGTARVVAGAAAGVVVLAPSVFTLAAVVIGRGVALVAFVAPPSVESADAEPESSSLSPSPSVLSTPVLPVPVPVPVPVPSTSTVQSPAHPSRPSVLHVVALLDAVLHEPITARRGRACRQTRAGVAVGGPVVARLVPLDETVAAHVEQPDRDTPRSRTRLADSRPRRRCLPRRRSTGHRRRSRPPV